MAAIPIITFLATLVSSDELWQVCDESASYTANSTYQSNINQTSSNLLDMIPSSSPALFATAAVGTIPDTVYALALCRGDIHATECAICVTNAFEDAQQLFPYKMDVTLYYDPCLLRFSNMDFLASLNNDKQRVIPNLENVTSPAAEFDAAVGALLNAIVDCAVNSPARFCTGEKDFDRSTPIIYGLAQCTPDMSSADCRNCLEPMVKVMPIHFSGRQGGRILGIRCNYRYEIYPIFFGNPLVHLPDQPGPGAGRKAEAIIKYVVVSCLALFVVVIVFVLIWCLREPERPVTSEQPLENCVNVNIPRKLTSEQINQATSGLQTKLGSGNFGEVYQGNIEGKRLAVKKLKGGLDVSAEEFEREMGILMKVRHMNVVKLLAYCNDGDDRFLCFEYLSGGSLDKKLYASQRNASLPWGDRYCIVKEICDGLHYLHVQLDSEEKILHMDLKAGNILIDQTPEGDLVVKIADFGVSRLFKKDQTHAYVGGEIIGTRAYLPPECFLARSRVSEKVDIYSFGMPLLEMVTGWCATDPDFPDADKFIRGSKRV